MKLKKNFNWTSKNFYSTLEKNLFKIENILFLFEIKTNQKKFIQYRKFSIQQKKSQFKIKNKFKNSNQKNQIKKNQNQKIQNQKNQTQKIKFKNIKFKKFKIKLKKLNSKNFNSRKSS